MSIDEASRLYWYILEKYKHLQPQIRRIGNGERVVFLVSVEYFLWSWKDWRQYMNTPT